MVDPGGDPTPAATGAAGDPLERALARLLRRRGIRLALVVLALLYASAIYAPLLASDRPLYIEAIDYRDYDGARRGLGGVTASLTELLGASPDAFPAARGGAEGWHRALAAERGALASRLATLRAWLSAEDAAELEGFEARVAALADAGLRGEPAPRGELEALGDEARSLRELLRPLRPDATPEGEGGVRLVPRRSSPLAKALGPLELFCMVLWLFVLGLPLWSRAAGRVLARRRGWSGARARRAKAALVLGTSVACALLWGLLVGGSATYDAGTWKPRLSSGDVVATRVVFAPLAFGFTESHMSESWRPPTWTSASEIDDGGRYVRGPRVPRPDPLSGELPTTSPVEVRDGEPARNAAWRHPLGTDSLGRDLLARVLWGGRISLSVGLISTVLLVAIGVLVGAVAGYAGGRVDLLLSRLIEIVQSIPAFFLILTVVALVPARELHPILAIVIVIALVRWTGVARLVRAELLRERELDFVAAARASGASAHRILFRHLLPNAIAPVLVAATFAVAGGILTESAISFLGFGIRHPVPSWGSLLNESRAAEYWWVQVFPGLLIFVTVFCYNVVGEGVRDALDPRMSFDRRPGA